MKKSRHFHRYFSLHLAASWQRQIGNHPRRTSVDPMNSHPRQIRRLAPPLRVLRSTAIALAIAVTTPAFAQDPAATAYPGDASATAHTEHAVGARIGADPSPSLDLRPGDYVWTPELAPAGPLVVVVSLPEQRAHVYRGGTRIGVSTISSGKPGHETPTGVFPILQKRQEHYSNLYDSAPMPYMQRLTWDGIALHAGRIPGKPASHGCIRLPMAFAKVLFAATERGVTVVVADESSHGPSVVWPSDRAPVDAYTGLEPGLSPHGDGATHGSDTMATLE